MIDFLELTEFHHTPVITNNSLKSLGLRGEPKKIIEEKIIPNKNYRNEKKEIEFTKEGLVSEKRIFKNPHEISDRIYYQYDHHNNITSLKHNFRLGKGFIHFKWKHKYDSLDRLTKVKMLQKSGSESDREFVLLKKIELDYPLRKSYPEKISFYNSEYSIGKPGLKKEIIFEWNRSGEINKKSIREYANKDSNSPSTEYSIRFIYDHNENLILKIIDIDNILEKNTYEDGHLHETTKYELKRDIDSNPYTEISKGIRFNYMKESRSYNKEVFSYVKKTELIDEPFNPHYDSRPPRYIEYITTNTVEYNMYIYEKYNDRTQIQFKNLFRNNRQGTIIHLLHDKYIKYEISKKRIGLRSRNLGSIANSAKLVRYQTDEIGNWLKKSHFSGEMTFDNEVPLESKMKLEKEEIREIQYH